MLIFFDVVHFPQISYTASGIAQSDKEGNHELRGRLTIKGITKLIQLNDKFGGIIKDPWGSEKAGFTITSKINHSDWVLLWNATLESGGFMISEEITITGEVELLNAGNKIETIVLEETTEKKAYY